MQIGTVKNKKIKERENERDNQENNLSYNNIIYYVCRMFYKNDERFGNAHRRKQSFGHHDDSERSFVSHLANRNFTFTQRKTFSPKK